MDTDLTNKQAFVCGSTSGIGRATAIELAGLGANVVLVARNEDKLQETLEELPVDKGQVHGYVMADFNSPHQLKTAMEEYLQNISEVHILVNNTGGPPGGPIYEASLQEFRDAMEAHLSCNHTLVQMLVPYMQQQAYGRIINIISTSVKEPISGLGVSNTTRGAVASWAKTLAGELGKYGITVNNVLPGFTNTDRLQNLIKEKAEKAGQEPEEMENSMRTEVPVNRFGMPQEIANMIAFLASPAASYLNGTSIPVDGGRTKSF